MPIRVGINGFGRIGRQIFRIMLERGGFDIAAVNDITDAPTLAYLLKYDSVMGRFKGTITIEGNDLVVNNDRFAVLAKKDPSELPWKDLRADIVVESTGKFTSRAECERHIAAGAKKVLLTAPPKDDVDATVVLGVNDDAYKPTMKVISNASCTTNCLAPMAKVLNDAFGIKRGLMTTVHSYTNDQRVLDLPHKDLRRARAAAINIIPTKTGAASAIGKVIPSLDKKLNGISLRVPTPDGSVTDLIVEVNKTVTVEEVNKAFRAAAEGRLKGILDYCDEPIVLTDIVGSTASCVFDSLQTMVIGGSMVKVLGWYDNEWAYSHRCVDLVQLMAK